MKVVAVGTTVVFFDLVNDRDHWEEVSRVEVKSYTDKLTDAQCAIALAHSLDADFNQKNSSWPVLQPGEKVTVDGSWAGTGNDWFINQLRNEIRRLDGMSSLFEVDLPNTKEDDSNE